MISYGLGIFDILRAEQLEELTEKINQSKQNGAEAFGVGVYEDELCKSIGYGNVLKSAENRRRIIEQIRGVDFAFSVPSLDHSVIESRVRQAYDEFLSQGKDSVDDQEKKYNLGIVIGSFDLFHEGHLGLFELATKNCKRLVVGIKPDSMIKIQKRRTPTNSEEERIEILKHFKFVDDVFLVNSENIRNVFKIRKSLEEKYGMKFDALIAGEDIGSEFLTALANAFGLTAIYNRRTPEMKEKCSTSTYRRKLALSPYTGPKKYTGNILKQIEESNLSKGKEERLFGELDDLEL